MFLRQSIVFITNRHIESGFLCALKQIKRAGMDEIL